LPQHSPEDEKSFQLVAGGTSDQLRWLEIDNGVKKPEDAASQLAPSEDPSSEEPQSEIVSNNEEAADEAVSGENAASDNATSVNAPSVKEAPSVKGAASVKAVSTKAPSTKAASQKFTPDDATDVDSDEPESYVLQCHDDVNNHLRQINEALSLISIMGPTRSGKSTLLNLLAGCTTEPLFSTSPGAESWTRGNARTGLGLTPAPYTY
jgi:ATPase subunit of ABC transporter with duplicated ATPase domains